MVQVKTNISKTSSASFIRVGEGFNVKGKEVPSQI
jgi:hypothetical protein